MNTKNLLKQLVNHSKFFNTSYSQRAYVREKYDIKSTVTEVTTIDEASDTDEIVSEETDKILDLIEIVNNAFTFGVIARNGNASDGAKQLSYSEAQNIFNFTTAPVTLFEPRDKLGNSIGDVSDSTGIGFRFSGSTFQSVTYQLPYFKILTDKLSAVMNEIENVKNLLTSSNYSKISAYYNDTANGFLTGFDVFMKDPATPQYLNPGANRESAKAYYNIYRDKVVLLQANLKSVGKYIANNTKVSGKTATTSDVFSTNEVAVEFTSFGFDLLKPEFSNFLYNTKTNPSPNGSAYVKIPSINSYLFASPLSSVSYFTAVASKYDEVQVVIDNQLGLRIKNFIADINTDEAHINTGKYEDQGINLFRTELNTGLVEELKLESSISNNYVHLTEKDVIINGTNGKIVLGLIGESNSMATPYDADILRLSEEVRNLKLIYDRLAINIIDTGIKYSRFTTNAQIETAPYLALDYISKNATNYTLNQVSSYDDFRTISDKLFQIAKSIKKYTLNESWSKRLAGSDWDQPKVNVVPFNEGVANLAKESNRDIADIIVKAVVGATNPLRSNRKSQLTDFKPNTRNNLYGSFFNYLTELNLPNYLNISKGLVNASAYYSEFQQERDKSVNYCSPEEGATIIALYFTVEYITASAALKNLKKLQSEYILTNTSDYSETLGTILSDLTNYLTGNLLSFTGVPGNPPVLQTTGAEQTINDELATINTRIKNLLL